MLILMIALATVGVALLIIAPLIARVIVGPSADSTAATRILRGIAVLLLIAALIARPYNPSTAAIPPSPNQPAAVRD